MKKVCFWFDRPDNTINLWGNMQSNFLHNDLLSKMYFDYEIKHIQIDKVSSKDINLYVIELRDQHISNIGKRFHKHLKEWMYKNDICLILYLPHEAGFYNNKFDHFDSFNLQLKNLPNKKYFIFGDLNVKKSYANTAYEVFDKVFPFDYFEYWTFVHIQSLSEEVSQKDKAFLCLNRHLTAERLALISLLHKEGLLNSGYISNLKILTPDKNYIDNAKDLIHDKEKSNINRVLEEPPIILDTWDNYDPAEKEKVNTYNFYKKSYFSLITESVQNDLFVTEKTYRSIRYGHPFIIYGAPFVLEYLQSKGYRTYESVFDESYDKEINSSKRLYMIIESVKKFVNLSSKEKKQKLIKMERIASYNKTLFLERAEHNYKRQWNTIIEEIIDDKKN